MPDPFDSSALVLVRVFIAVMVFSIIYLVFFKEKVNWKKDGSFFVLASITGVVVNTLLFFKGLSLSQPIDAAIIMSTTPIITFLIAVVIRAEIISFISLTGSALAFLGVYSLITKNTFYIPAVSFGNVLLLINATAYAFYLTYIKGLVSSYNPMTVIFYTFVIAFPFIAFFGVDGLLEVNINSLSSEDWLVLVFVIIFVTILVYVFINFSAHYLPASLLAFYNYLQPIFAIIFAMLIGSDEIKMYEVYGIFSVLTGLLLININQYYYRRKSIVSLTPDDKKGI
jgi:drug/metabolite transporter (DMT)-like permease